MSMSKPADKTDTWCVCAWPCCVRANRSEPIRRHPKVFYAAATHLNVARMGTNYRWHWICTHMGMSGSGTPYAVLASQPSWKVLK